MSAELEICACCGRQADVKTMQVSYAGNYICKDCCDAGEEIRKCFGCNERIITRGKKEEEHERLPGTPDVYFCADCCEPEDRSGYPSMFDEMDYEIKYQMKYGGRHE